jgi:hypothetical protein
VAGVQGGDAAILSTQEWTDDADDADDESDGQMMGDDAGDGSSTVATCIAVGGSVMLLLNSGAGSSSNSTWNDSFGNRGSGFE